jgi:hypothetical protein
MMHGLIEQLSVQPIGKQLAGGCINEKKRYAAHIGFFLSDPSRGEKLAHRCLFNKRSRACLALYTAVDIAYQILRREQIGAHNSAHRLAVKQAADQIERDLLRICGFLRPVFLDRRSFITQFANGGDIDDENAGPAHGQLGGAELHRVMADATYRSERFLQIYANCSLTWAVMLAVEPEMQKVQDKLMPQNAKTLEKNAFIGSIFRLEWKKPVAQMALHVIAKHIILILNVPMTIRVPVVKQLDIQQLRNDSD